MSAPSLPQLAATLTLLLVKHPEIADLPLRAGLRNGQIDVEVKHGSPDTPRAAAVLAKALRVKSSSYTGVTTDGCKYECYEVTGRFSGVPIGFLGYVYPGADAKGGAL